LERKEFGRKKNSSQCLGKETEFCYIFHNRYPSNESSPAYIIVDMFTTSSGR
jgi:hypothetical protein